jgi:hypothetical protein
MTNEEFCSETDEIFAYENTRVSCFLVRIYEQFMLAI